MNADVQLALDGAHTTHPTPRPRALTQRQRAVVSLLRAHRHVRPFEVGMLMRSLRATPPRRGAQRHISSDGFDALRRLERRGLVEHVARGRWRLVEHDEHEWTP